MMQKNEHDAFWLVLVIFCFPQFSERFLAQEQFKNATFLFPDLNHYTG